MCKECWREAIRQRLPKQPQTPEPASKERLSTNKVIALLVSGILVVGGLLNAPFTALINHYWKAPYDVLNSPKQKTPSPLDRKKAQPAKRPEPEAITNPQKEMTHALSATTRTHTLEEQPPSPAAPRKATPDDAHQLCPPQIATVICMFPDQSDAPVQSGDNEKIHNTRDRTSTTCSSVRADACRLTNIEAIPCTQVCSDRSEPVYVIELA